MTSAEVERFVTRLMEAMCQVVWGFAPRMIPHIVHSLGPGRSILWVGASMPRMLWTIHALGPVRTHLAAVAISLYYGCTYCAYGHAFALELIYLRDRGHLFPVDAHTLATWLGLEPRVLARRLRTVLQDAGLHAEMIWVDRTLEIAAGAGPTDVDEVRIAHLVRMLGVMTRIAIEAGIEPDEAQNSINKNADLKKRYVELRAAARP
jgi:hypothetical protein